MNDRIHTMSTALHFLHQRTGKEHDRHADKRAKVEQRATLLLMQIQDPVLRAVLEHHWPVMEHSWPVCLGCDNDEGPEAEPAEWPCSTWTLVEEEQRALVS